MKIILINPPVKNKKPATVLPPLGLMYIAAVLENDNIDVIIIDAIADQMDVQEVADIISKEQPDIVGITVCTSVVKTVESLIKKIKENSHEIKIVLGGPHVTSLPVESLELGADIIVIGEGEKTMLDICKKPDKKNISGTAVMINRKSHINEPRPLLKDLDSLPMPARHLVDLDKYFSAGTFKKPFTTILTSRGCPGMCIYCNKAVFGNTFRARKPKNIVNEIEFLIDKYGIREFDIMDDTFTLNADRAEKVCNLIIEKCINITWRCPNGIRVDCVSEHLLSKMKQAGCHHIAFGVESGDDRVLAQIGKGITTTQIRSAFHTAKKVGLDTMAFLMIGLPFDTKETMQKTIDLAIELDPDYAQFTMTIPLPSTQLYTWFSQKYGKVEWEKLDFFKGKAVFETENFTKQEVEYFYKRAYRQFYMRPSYIVKNIMRMRSREEIKARLIGLKNLIKLAR